MEHRTFELFAGLPEVLGSLRRKKNLRQGDVSRQLGVSVTMLSRYENGGVVIPLDKLDELLGYYGIRSLAELEILLHKERQGTAGGASESLQDLIRRIAVEAMRDELSERRDDHGDNNDETPE